MEKGLDGGHRVIFQHAFFLQRASVEKGPFKPGIAKIEAEGAGQRKRFKVAEITVRTRRPTGF